MRFCLSSLQAKLAHAHRVFSSSQRSDDQCDILEARRWARGLWRARLGRLPPPPTPPGGPPPRDHPPPKPPPSPRSRVPARNPAAALPGRRSPRLPCPPRICRVRLIPARRCRCSPACAHDVHACLSAAPHASYDVHRTLSPIRLSHDHHVKEYDDGAGAIRVRTLADAQMCVRCSDVCAGHSAQEASAAPEELPSGVAAASQEEEAAGQTAVR